MENNEVNEIEVVCKKNVGETQINNSISVGGDDLKITKVLTINAKPFIEKTTVLNGAVKVEGYVEYDLLTILENNDIVFNTEKSLFVVDFQSKEVLENSCVEVLAEIAEINNISDEKLNITSIVKFKFSVVNTSNVVNSAIDNSEIYIKTKDMDYSCLVGKVNYKFQTGFEENKDSRFNKVLFVASNVAIKDIVPANDYFVVNGEVYVTIVFQNEDGVIKSVVKEINFSEEVEFNGTNKDSVIVLNIVTGEIEVVENAENKSYLFNIPLEITGEVYERRTCKTVVDAYSLCNVIKLTTASFEDEMFYATKQLNATISTTANINENLEQIDKILAIIPNNIVSINQIVKDKILLVEGIVNVNIIYYSLDSDNAEVLNSFDIDVPYSLKFDIPELKEGDYVYNKLVVRDISIKNKFGKELEIFIDFITNYSVVSNSTNAIVTKIEMGEEKEREDYALEVYLTNNENSLWDIAKRLNISVEDLVKQNGELIMPIQNGERIVAYKQRNISFD